MGDCLDRSMASYVRAAGRRVQEPRGLRKRCSSSATSALMGACHQAGAIMEVSSTGSTRGRISWALYDWGSSSFAAIISTFVFPVYFAKQVALDEATGTGQWGLTVGLAGLVVAVGGPILGAIADQYQRRKPWLGFFTLLC